MTWPKVAGDAIHAAIVALAIVGFLAWKERRRK